jgi:hypothetical protein
METGAIVKLNVGGRRFESTVGTLIQAPYFEARLSGRWEYFSGEIFVDRDGEGFYHVLELLRKSNHEFPARFDAELDFYGLGAPDRELPLGKLDDLQRHSTSYGELSVLGDHGSAEAIAAQELEFEMGRPRMGVPTCCTTNQNIASRPVLDVVRRCAPDELPVEHSVSWTVDGNVGDEIVGFWLEFRWKNAGGAQNPLETGQYEDEFSAIELISNRLLLQRWNSSAVVHWNLLRSTKMLDRIDFWDAWRSQPDSMFHRLEKRENASFLWVPFCLSNQWARVPGSATPEETASTSFVTSMNTLFPPRVNLRFDGVRVERRQAKQINLWVQSRVHRENPCLSSSKPPRKILWSKLTEICSLLAERRVEAQNPVCFRLRGCPLEVGLDKAIVFSVDWRVSEPGRNWNHFCRVRHVSLLRNECLVRTHDERELLHGMARSDFHPRVPVYRLDISDLNTNLRSWWGKPEFELSIEFPNAPQNLPATIEFRIRVCSECVAPYYFDPAGSGYFPKFSS